MAARKYKNPLSNGTCAKCGADFVGQKNKKYCSKNCYYAVFREENREQVRANNTKYDQSAKGKQKHAEWLEKNSERHVGRRKEYYEENKPRFLQRAAKFAAENPEKVHGYKVKFSKTDAGRELAHVGRQRRLAKERQAHDDGTVTRKSWRAMVLHYRHHCLRCGLKHKFRQLSMDHVLPISRGGAHTIKNLQPLCLSCNAKKGNKIAWDYRGLFDCDYGEFVGETL